MHSDQKLRCIWAKVRVRMGIKVGISTRAIKAIVIKISMGIGAKAKVWARIGRES